MSSGRSFIRKFYLSKAESSEAIEYRAPQQAADCKSIALELTKGMVWSAALLSVLLVSSLSLLALFALRINETTLKRVLPYLVSLAVGALFGDALIHLLPESLHRDPESLKVPLLCLAGVFGSFFFEYTVAGFHPHHEHPHHEGHAHVHDHVHPAAFINLFGSSTHNFLDGVLIGTSYLAGMPVGIATTLAVVLHEIPHELGDFGILVGSGLSVRRAMLFNFFSACFAILGTLVALGLGTRMEGFSTLMLPFTAGTFIYLAGTDLLPELLKPALGRFQTLGRFFTLGVGLGLMVLIRVLE